MSVQLYSVYHRPFFIPQAGYITPIQAGKAISNVSLGFQGDDTGDNISHLNGTFCELTVKYWIWKNAPRDKSHWGLSHYRRYFVRKPFRLFGAVKTVEYDASQEAIDKELNESLLQNIESLLQSHQVIIQQPMYVHRNKKGLLNIKEHYLKDHIASDWKAVEDAVLKLYPEYAKSLDAFNRSYQMSFYNMMIAPWSVWDAYLQWLFDVLFEVKANITVSEDAYQSRVFGFMSERLINLFIWHNRLNTAYLPVAMFK